MKNHPVSCAIVLVLLAGALHGAPAKEGDGFPIRDFLGRDWKNELVTFPLEGAQLAAARAGRSVVGPDGQPVPSQMISPSTGVPRIAFLADLKPYETKAWRFGDGPAPKATSLMIEDTPDTIRIWNEFTGISVRKALKGGGPIESVRLRSGTWVGGSQMTGEGVVSAWSATLSASGPAFAEITCRGEHGKGKDWEIRFRLISGEAAVLVDESFSLGTEIAWRLLIDRGFSPDRIYHRLGQIRGKETTGVLVGDPLAPPAGEMRNANMAYLWEPWLHWNSMPRRNTWFGLYGEGGSDLLFFGARNAAVWVDPARTGVPQGEIILSLEDGLHMDLPLNAGRRSWMIGAYDKEACLEGLKTPRKAPIPQLDLVRLGDFPLELIKSYVLQWPAEKDEYPRLFVKKSDLPEIKKSVEVDPQQLERLKKLPYDQMIFRLDEFIPYLLASGDPDLEKHVAKGAVKWIRECIDSYLVPDEQPTMGYGPNNRYRIRGALNMLDALFAGNAFSAEEKERLRAQVAFLGYMFTRTDAWSPERGFCANPNMTTILDSYVLAIACLIPSHPLAKEWAGLALTEFRQEVEQWSDANGGWMEAPHYALVSMHLILAEFIMAQRNGYGDDVYSPRLRKCFEWLGKISTPPDPRVENHRHLPPIGHTYINNWCGDFGLLAAVWKEKDPAFASEMMWIHRQHGSPVHENMGGASFAVEGYRKFLEDLSLPDKVPAWKSELFPETGAILRNTFPSERETQLHMIAGKNHAHYDNDSGSIVFWGKGRNLCEDFGYYAAAPAEDCSMVESPAASAAGLMAIRDFAPSARFDYLGGVKGAWWRQILFVKDPDPLGPNYFVLADTFRVPIPATWRLWLTASKVTPAVPFTRVEGKEDVDLDIVFFGADPFALKTEEKMRKSPGIMGNRQVACEITQTGLIAEVERGRSVNAVLYPRLKTEAPPTVTPVAEGRGVKVVTPAGTDWVFVDQRAFTFQGEGISFSGRAGAVQLRGKKTYLFLGDGGEISANGRALKIDKAGSKDFE